MSSAPIVIKAEDRRVCRIYYNYLLTNNLNPPAITNFDDIKHCNTVINTVMQHCYPDNDQRLTHIQHMQFIVKPSLIPDIEFEWFKNNEQACYWVWGYLRSADRYMLKFPYQPSYFEDADIPPYENMKLETSPVNTQHRYNLVVDFFDSWYEQPANKTQLIEHLKKEWQAIYAKPKPFKWLDINDDEQCEWVWNYIVQAQKPEPLKYITSSERMKIPTLYLSPLNIEEKKLAIYAAIDLWRGHKDSIKLFFKNINKTVSQQKHRIKKIDSKPFNTYLKIDTKARLDEIARRQDKKIIDIIDQLINQAYDALPPE